MEYLAAAFSLAVLVLLWNYRSKIREFFNSGPKSYSLAERVRLMQEAKAEALAHAAALEVELANTRDDLSNAEARLALRQTPADVGTLEREMQLLTASSS